MYELPKLKYLYNELEPYIDAQTMEIHYSKHHQAYVNNLNKALESVDLAGKTLENILQDLDSVPENLRTVVRNNGGGHYNHSFFWEIMGVGGKSSPEGSLLSKINNTFGGFDNFKIEFGKAAIGRFGSGWAWLAEDNSKNLKIYSTPNQDNPIMQNEKAILALDVWEHAYYLKYQNRRQDYIDNWWNVVDWEAVEKKYQQIVV